MRHHDHAKMSAARIAMAAATAMTLAMSAAHAAGDKAKGAKLAQQWCNSCHTVAARDTSRKFNAGPEFLDLAKKSRSYLVTAINKPHDFMPKFPTLSGQDKADLVAHIQSLE